MKLINVLTLILTTLFYLLSSIMSIKRKSSKPETTNKTGRISKIKKGVANISNKLMSKIKGKKTNNNEHEEQNPIVETEVKAKIIPNSDWISKGYNVAFGNPFVLPGNGQSDQGFSQSIFAHRYTRNLKTSDGAFYYPDGYEISIVSLCDKKFSSENMEKQNEFREKMSLSLGLSASIGAFAFSANTQYSRMRDTMVNEQKIFVNSNASCSRYQAKLTRNIPPQLSNNFIAALKNLSTNHNGKEAFRFLDEFGTHYISDITMGSKYSCNQEITKEMKSKIEASNLSISAVAEYNALKSVKLETKFENEQSKKESFSNQLEKSSCEFVGSPATSGLDDWLKEVSKHERVMPTTYKLKDITDLFEMNDIIIQLKNENINVNDVKKKINEAISNYCQNYLIKEGKVRTCSIKVSPPIKYTHKHTEWSDAGHGDIFYLDRHNVRCGENEAIGRINYERSHNSMRYSYDCIHSTYISNVCRTPSTTPNSVDSNSRKGLIFLDRHHVQCNDKEVLRQFKLERNDDRIWYSYTCCTAGTKDPYELQTKNSSIGDGTTFYLDRQPIEVPQNQILRSLLMKREPGDHLKYKYIVTKLED